MGIASGINYNGMNDIIKLIENRMTIISETFETLSTDVVSEIAAAYSGEAATAYKETLNTISTQMDTDLNDLITKLKTAIDETQTEYDAQDKKMQESVAEAKAGVVNND